MGCSSFVLFGVDFGVVLPFQLVWPAGRCFGGGGSLVCLLLVALVAALVAILLVVLVSWPFVRGSACLFLFVCCSVGWAAFFLVLVG